MKSTFALLSVLKVASIMDAFLHVAGRMEVDSGRTDRRMHARLKGLWIKVLWQIHLRIYIYIYTLHGTLPIFKSGR